MPRNHGIIKNPPVFPKLFRVQAGFLYGYFALSVLSAAAQISDTVSCSPVLLHAGMQHSAAQTQRTDFLPGIVFHAMRLLSGLCRFGFPVYRHSITQHSYEYNRQIHRNHPRVNPGKLYLFPFTIIPVLFVSNRDFYQRNLLIRG